MPKLRCRQVEAEDSNNTECIPMKSIDSEQIQFQGKATEDPNIKYMKTWILSLGGSQTEHHKPHMLYV